jgi:hypothetical protein
MQDRRCGLKEESKFLKFLLKSRIGMNFYNLKHGYREIAKEHNLLVDYYLSFQTTQSGFQCTNNPPSGNHWAVESEIFWKARGDHLQFTEAAVACVFKKFMRRLPDGTTQVRGWSEVPGARRKKWGQSTISSVLGFAPGRALS